MNTHNVHVIFPQDWNQNRMIHGDGTCIICGQDLGDQVYSGPKCRVCFLNRIENNWSNGGTENNRAKDRMEENSKFQEDWYDEPEDEVDEQTI